MRLTRWTSLAALGALALACAAPAAEKKETGPTAADVAVARTAIEAANTAAVGAFNAGDLAKWSSVYAEDAIMMMPNAEAWKGRAAIEAGAKAMTAAMAISNLKFTTEDVMLGGDLAVETGTNEMTITPKKGKPIVDKGKYVTTWKRQADGSWKVLRDISNSNLPAGM